MELSAKIDKARNSGVPDEEIAGFMAQRDPEFAEKYAKSTEKGISSREVLDFIKRKEQAEFLKLPYELQAAKIQEASSGAGVEVARSYIEGSLPGVNRLFNKLEEEGYIPEREYSPESSTVGSVAKMAGAINPIKLIHKGVTAAAQHGPQWLKNLAHYGGAGAATGALHVTGRELAEKGELPEYEDVLWEAGTFGLLEGLVTGGLRAREAYKAKFGDGKSAEKIVAPFVEGAPQSKHEVAKKAAQFFDESPPPPPSPPPSPPPPPPPPRGPSTPPPFSEIHVSQPQRPRLPGGRTITREQSRQLGLTQPSTPRNPNAEQAIRGVFPERVANSTEVGASIAHNIRARRDGAWQVVNNLYNASRAEMSEAVGEFPDLVQQLQARIRSINAIPRPDQYSKGVRRTARSLLNRLVRRNEKGEITGLNRVSAQTLVDQIQATRRDMEFPFKSGNASNVYNPLITEIENAIDTVVDTEQWAAARQARRNFADLYDNKYVSKFSDTDNYDLVKNLESLQDKDTFNVARRILDQTQEGVAMRNGIQAKIAENHLKEFWNNPRGADPVKLREQLDELRSVLEPEQLERIEGIFQQERLPFNRRATERETIPKRMQKEAETQKKADEARVKAERETRQREARQRQIAKEQERQAKIAAHASKIMKLSPEKVLKKFNTVSGIEEAAVKLKDQPNIFNELRLIKNRDIAFNKQLRGKVTGKQLSERFLQSDNHDILVALNGEEAVEAAIEAAEQLNNKEVTVENIKSLVKKGVAVKLLMGIFGV